MEADELHYLSASEILRLYRSGALSPVEYMRATIARAEKLNPILNAICTPTYDMALQEARRAEVLLRSPTDCPPIVGIPTTIKDLALTENVRTMAGSHVFATRIPEIDHLHVRRMKNAGLISIGKTTTSEFGWSGVSRSPLTGATHNPWQVGMNAGASSAGAAVCAASGIGPMHQGSDGAGSIRIPAAFCGVYGFKPSHGRVPYFPMPVNGLISHVGPITRTVEDAALMLQSISGPDDLDITSIDQNPDSYVRKLDSDLSELRIGYSPDLGYLPIDQEVKEVVSGALHIFEDLGCVVDEVRIPWQDPRELQYCMFSVSLLMMYGDYVRDYAKKMDPGLIEMIELGKTYTAVEYAKAQGDRFVLYEKVRSIFEHIDVLITPTLSVAAFPHSQLIPDDWDSAWWDWMSWAGFSYPFNLTWLPAASVPCGVTSKGLPVGLQIVCKKNADLLVFQVSKGFESAKPWAHRRPIF